MDKFVLKMKDAVKKYGFVDTAKMIGINKFKLAELTELPIKGDTFQESNEIVVGDLLPDLVKENPNYKHCELFYYDLDGAIQWYCKLMDEDNYYSVTVYATPYWGYLDTTQIDLTNIEVTPKDSPEDENEYETFGNYYKTFENPKSFNDLNELINWFENVYKPKTYSEILDLVEQFKLKELL